MAKPLRILLALVAGIVVAFLAIMLVEVASHLAYPPPADLDVTDSARMRAHVAAMPAGALLSVLAAWMAGAFAGGVVAAAIARHWPRLWCGVITAMVLAGVLATFTMVPHPAWFMLVALLAVPLAGWLAGRVARRLVHGASTGTAEVAP